MAMADLALDYFETFDDDFVRALPEMGPNGKYWPLWVKYFEDMFASSPALCLRFPEVKPWYSPSTASYAEAGCRRQTATTSNKPPSKPLQRTR